MTLVNTAVRADVLLADGAVAVIRSLAPDDAAALHALHEGVSDEAIRLRFFAPSRDAAHRYVDKVLGDQSTLALVAQERGRVLGVATAEPMDTSTCEIAFLVADDARGRGVGTLLVEHLAALALERGYTQFEADVLLENHAMLEVFANAGFQASRTPDGSTVIVALTTGASDNSRALADAREFAAEARSLAPMLRPRGVAVVGVRTDGTGIGAAVLGSIRSGGFAGELAVVHPRASHVHGVDAFPSLKDVPGPVDVVIVCVPAEHVLEVIEQAAQIDVRAAVVVSSGFTELGPEGASIQRKVAQAARDGGIRLVGPNCLGLLANSPDVRLNATFSDNVPPSGGLAVATQSGGVGIVLSDLARELDLGVHTLVSLGNKADVSSNDLLAAWYDDPTVTAAALYLESFGNAAKFARFARRFAERKPLLAALGGRSAGGARAGASHTAAAATPAIGVDALFAQAGVIGCDDAEDLARTALLLAEQPRPQGRRIAILSNAGGMGVLAADAAGEAGLEVPEFSAGVQAQLAALVRGTTGTSNPVDAGAGVPPEEFAAMLEVLFASGEADAVLVLPVATGVTDAVASMDAIAEARARYPDIPAVVVPLGGLPTPAGLTAYRTTASAVRALGRVARYAEWLRIDHVSADPTPVTELVAHRQAVRGLLEEDLGGGWVTPPQAAAVLQGYGIEPLGVTVQGADAAAQAAQEQGFPVALKLADPEVVHKTDRGLVRVGLRDQAEVRAAVSDFEAELGRAPSVLVQPMATGVEIALGLVRDPALGPLVMVAAGGIATDIWDDRAFLVPPVSRTDAARAVRTLRIWPLLEGYRGSAPADVDSLESMIAALGRLAVDIPEVAELDLNPVMVSPSGCAVVDVKLRVDRPVGPDAGAPRQLRPVVRS
ncbi:GNAT family N-acetyltransferase [Nocardioides sp.]|uniref:bifunctional acetate--CoA ligase family protein/GNAT family N-acetyltransferase n=1 Tax=Nocardioides sp. TaxID=35761 RepID=UPI003563BD67